ncbi:MAG: hypothetical protein ACPGRE_10180 [Flavobacteriaceae bacterium]
MRWNKFVVLVGLGMVLAFRLVPHTPHRASNKVEHAQKKDSLKLSEHSFYKK